MSYRRFFALLSPAILFIFALPLRSTPATDQDPLEKAWSQYSSSNNPVDKAKTLAKLAPRQLSAIRDLVSADQDDKALAALEKYRDAVSETTNALKGAGIDAARKPNGFKELQISVRTFLRKLNDLTLSLEQDSRPAYRAAQADLEGDENTLIDALFPKQDSKHSATASRQ